MTERSSIVRPLPGDGVVAREGSLLLVCGAAPGDLVQALLAAVRDVAGQGGHGRDAVHRVAQVLGRFMPGSADTFACAVAGPTGDGMAVLVSGTATAWITGPGQEVTMSGVEALTWSDRLVPGPVDRVELSLAGTGMPGPADPWLRLDGGVVPGGGLESVYFGTAASAPAAQDHQQHAHNQHQPAPKAGRSSTPKPPVRVAPAQASPSPAPPAPVASNPARPARVAANPAPAPAPGPGPSTPAPIEAVPAPPPAPARIQAELRATMLDEAQPEPFEAVLLLPQPGAAPSAAPQPATLLAPAPELPEPDARPLVYGADCKNGHLNDPRVQYCGVCGIAMAQITLLPRQGPRPPLGLLVLDDGSALSLETDYILGRDPEHAQEVIDGQARPLRVTDTEGTISRRHMRIVLEQWDVKVMDLGSVNGTWIQDGPDQPYRQIPPNQPVLVLPGTVVRVGQVRTFRYESNRRR